MSRNHFRKCYMNYLWVLNFFNKIVTFSWPLWNVGIICMYSLKAAKSIGAWVEVLPRMLFIELSASPDFSTATSPPLRALCWSRPREKSCKKQKKNVPETIHNVLSKGQCSLSVPPEIIKNRSFFMFAGGTEKGNWPDMGWRCC